MRDLGVRVAANRCHNGQTASAAARRCGYLENDKKVIYQNVADLENHYHMVINKTWLPHLYLALL